MPEPQTGIMFDPGGQSVTNDEIMAKLKAAYTTLPPEAEGARSLLATLAEAPVTQLLQWVLEIMHTVIDPWSLVENPEEPDISFELHVPDAPVREALAYWRRNNPGVLPEEVLR